MTTKGPLRRLDDHRGSTRRMVKLRDGQRYEIRLGGLVARIECCLVDGKLVDYVEVPDGGAITLTSPNRGATK